MSWPLVLRNSSTRQLPDPAKSNCISGSTCSYDFQQVDYSWPEGPARTRCDVLFRGRTERRWCPWVVKVRASRGRTPERANANGRWISAAVFFFPNPGQTCPGLSGLAGYSALPFSRPTFQRSHVSCLRIPRAVPCSDSPLFSVKFLKLTKNAASQKACRNIESI